MQQKFLTWLFLLICAAFAVAGGLSFLQFQRQSEARAKDLMSNRLHDLMLLIRYTQDNMQHVVQINEESTIERTRALAEIIRLNPSILHEQDALQGLCNDLGARQICVTNEKGVIIAAVPKSAVGLDLSNHEQSRPFLKCITMPGYELLQRPQINVLSGQIIQYAGVTRLDEPGLVQLGFTAQHEQIVRASSDFEKLASRIMGGAIGHIVAFREGKQLNRGALNLPTASLLSLPLNAVGAISLGGVTYATYAIEENGMRLVSLMPWSEISKVSFKSLRGLLLSNIGLFVLMFIVVWVLLRHYVLKGMRRINHSLRRITEGYIEERVEVTDTPEFLRLSNGINAMVDSLQSYGEQKRELLHKELQLASAIQSTVLPNQFPAFPEHTEFDIYATNVQAQVVGGDFYDFFMPEDKHLCFLLGDVTATGIPAALFMMRAITIIRELAKTGATPQELVTKANNELCAAASDMKLSLFYGRLNITTGDLRFVNAGTPQALRRIPGGNYEMMAMRSGALLGSHMGASYTECRLTLNAGDRLFLYTHGVINASDAENTPFGMARLEEALSMQADYIADVPRQVRTSLQRFSGNMEQRSDITMLALEFRGKWSQRAEIKVPSDAPDGIRELMAEKLEAVLAAPDDISSLQETLQAIIKALPPATTVELHLNCNENEAQIILHYNRPQFNPLISLPHLSIDKATFSSDGKSRSTLKLRKSLQ